jgi:predicted site-specific integrase-resolvase
MATGADLGLTGAAQVIGVSTKTIRRWIVAGELPA